jgi:hypothetical protein
VRYTVEKGHVVNLDETAEGCRKGEVLAVLSKKQKKVFHGSAAKWKHATAPPVLYEYVYNETDKENLFVWVYSNDGHDAKRHIATVQRRVDGHYPSNMQVKPEVVHHLLLIVLFLI